MPHTWVWLVLFLSAFVSVLYIAFVYVQDQAENDAVIDLRQMSEALFRSHIHCWLDGATLEAFLHSSPLRQLVLGCSGEDRKQISRFLRQEGWATQDWVNGTSVENGKVELRYYQPSDAYYKMCVPPILREYLGVQVYIPHDAEKAADFRKAQIAAESRAALGSMFKRVLLS